MVTGLEPLLVQPLVAQLLIGLAKPLILVLVIE